MSEQPSIDKMQKLLLIEAVKKHPFLYDPRHKDYNNKKLKNEIWSEITESLGHNISGTKVRTIWSCLKASYVRSVTARTVPKTQYATEMEFLLPSLERPLPTPTDEDLGDLKTTPSKPRRPAAKVKKVPKPNEVKPKEFPMVSSQTATVTTRPVPPLVLVSKSSNNSSMSESLTLLSSNSSLSNSSPYTTINYPPSSSSTSTVTSFSSLPSLAIPSTMDASYSPLSQSTIPSTTQYSSIQPTLVSLHGTESSVPFTSMSNFMPPMNPSLTTLVQNSVPMSSENKTFQTNLSGSTFTPPTTNTPTFMPLTSNSPLIQFPETSNFNSSHFPPTTSQPSQTQFIPMSNFSQIPTTSPVTTFPSQTQFVSSFSDASNSVPAPMPATMISNFTPPNTNNTKPIVYPNTFLPPTPPKPQNQSCFQTRSANYMPPVVEDVYPAIELLVNPTTGQLFDVERFLTLVNIHPEIYNPYNEFFFDKGNIKFLTWEYVASEMNESLEKCQKIWEILQNYYAKCRAYEMKMEKISKFEYRNQMEFLAPFIHFTQAQLQELKTQRGRRSSCAINDFFETIEKMLNEFPEDVQEELNTEIAKIVTDTARKYQASLALARSLAAQNGEPRVKKTKAKPAGTDTGTPAKVPKTSGGGKKKSKSNAEVNPVQQTSTSVQVPRPPDALQEFCNEIKSELTFDNVTPVDICGSANSGTSFSANAQQNAISGEIKEEIKEEVKEEIKEENDDDKVISAAIVSALSEVEKLTFMRQEQSVINEIFDNATVIKDEKVLEDEQYVMTVLSSQSNLGPIVVPSQNNSSNMNETSKENIEVPTIETNQIDGQIQPVDPVMDSLKEEIKIENDLQPL